MKLYTGELPFFFAFMVPSKKNAFGISVPRTYMCVRVCLRVRTCGSAPVRTAAGFSSKELMAGDEEGSCAPALTAKSQIKETQRRSVCIEAGQDRWTGRVRLQSWLLAVTVAAAWHGALQSVVRLRASTVQQADTAGLAWRCAYRPLPLARRTDPL